MIIRTAGLGDLETLLELGRRTFYEAFKDVNTEENMNLFLEAHFKKGVLEEEMEELGAHFFIAEEEGIAMGFSRVRLGHEPVELEGKAALEVERIYVLQEYQNRKVGEALMEHNMAYARANGFACIWLGVWQQNKRAIRFYERWGFIVFGTHIFMLGNDPQTDQLMSRPL